MPYFIKILISVFIVLGCASTPAICQKKKPVKDSVKLVKPLKVDTIIVNTIPAKEKAQTEIIPLYETKKTIIKVNTPGNKKDTVFATKKPKIDTISATGKKVRIMLDTGVCQCVSMDVKAQDTIDFGQYLNYSFKFTNKCKETIYINSSSFRFIPYNVFGHAVKVLRKVAFVKRFDIPEFVKIMPGENYEFQFADDAFFEFDLHKSQEYKFTFLHSNISTKNRLPKSKTFLCTEKRDLKVFVK